MLRFRDIAAWTFLAVFTAGGVFGPALHQVHHAIEESRAPIPAEGIGWAQIGDDEAGTLDAFECTVCLVHLLVEPPSLEPFSAVRLELTSSGASLTSHTSAAVGAAPFIRGPPSLG